MAYNEILTNRVRAALAHLPNVDEKKMFGGIAFMVNGKMCVTVGKNRLMVRIDPAMHEKALESKGTRTVVMKGREYEGYIYVSEASVETDEAFDHWIRLALDYNPKAKASSKRKKK